MTANTELTKTEVEQNRSIASETRKQFLAESEKFDLMEKKATVMASAVATIPKHLQGNVGDCLAIIMMADNWGMNAFAVAQKTHTVNGVLGYEAQLVNAIVTTSNKVTGAFHYEWYGDWSKIIGKFKTLKNQQGKPYQVPDWEFSDEVGLGIKVYATLRGESEPRVLDLLLSQAQVRNSTLWASDPRQQLAYLGVKRWARLFAPDVILGVYSPDELRSERVVNPGPPAGAAADAIDHGDEKLYIHFFEVIESITDLAKLEGFSTKEIGPAIQKRILNSEQIAGLKQAFRLQKKFINDTKAAEMAASENNKEEG
jgi:hypothetical protein